VLSRVNRIVRGADFRTVVRSGRRFPAECAVVYVRRGDPEAASRFGFIVSKAVGTAVTRNLVARRLRSVSRDLLSTSDTGVDVVIRALPGIADVPWPTLHESVERAVDRGVAKS
jgi:ribonuclease P protein component